LATSEEKAHLYSNWCFLLAVTEQRCSEVETLVFDLFANLGASGNSYLKIFAAIQFGGN
jgi:hypothetical protein